MVSITIDKTYTYSNEAENRMKNGRLLFTRVSEIILIITLILAPALLLQGCGGEKNQNKGNSSQSSSSVEENHEKTDTVLQNEAAGQNTKDADDADDTEDTENTESIRTESSEGNTADPVVQKNTPPAIDLNEVKPNETGRIMVVMFHNFIEEYKKGDKDFTTTFGEFEKLLDTLYTSGYRLISMNDYLNGNIDTPAGCIPMVFTFDDGSAGEFNLIESDGILAVNPRSAVGIMEEFNKTHPDFGTKGTFYINLGNSTFSGEGTLTQRLEYLLSKGFELGNHTYSHINLKEAKTAAKIQEEIGGNQKKILELIPNYIFTTFSLPYGAPAEGLKQYVIEGEWEGIKYKNLAIMEVGWDPAPSPFSVKFDPLATHRVRASGIAPVDADLAWWLENLKRDKQYISDGDAATVTVPEASAEYVDQTRLNGRELVTY